MEQNCYYVDKTDFIKTVFYDTRSKVQLITRPRRFGKTFTLSTFKCFLAINSDAPGDLLKQERLFANTHILSNEGTSEEVAQRREFVQKYMGKFPVIFLSLKSVEGLTFKTAYESFARLIREFANEVRYLRESPRLDKAQKAELEDLLNIKFLRDLAHKDILPSFTNSDEFRSIKPEIISPSFTRLSGS